VQPQQPLFDNSDLVSLTAAPSRQGAFVTHELLDVEIDKLMPDPTQPRKTFPKEAIDGLATSIGLHGVQTPLRVIVDDARGCWLILTGESRWRAARQAGLTHVPCLVVTGELSEAERLADRLTENMLRNDLSAIDEAAGIARLKQLEGCSSKALATKFGFSPAQITRAEALLSLPESIQGMVNDGRVPESAGYELSRLPDEQSQLSLAQEIAAKRLTRDELAKVVRGRLGKRSARPADRQLAFKLDGVRITVSSTQALTWDDFNKAFDRIRKEAKQAYDAGKEIAALRSLKAS
jgi:ParB family chromosome partitioning protein